MNISSQPKRASPIKFSSLAPSLLSNSSKENLIRFTHLAEKIPQKDSYREKIVQFLVDQFLEGTNRRKNFASETGFYPPRSILISPTMRCNLHCYGCHAGDYSKEGELEAEEIDRILNEAEEMGIHLAVVLGGEPFLRKDLFEIYSRHPHMIFHVFTHGGFLDEATVEKIASMGNVSPAISLEGFDEATDRRRGKGHFRQVMRGMGLLREAKVLFACSLTQTRENAREVESAREEREIQ